MVSGQELRLCEGHPGFDPGARIDRCPGQAPGQLHVVAVSRRDGRPLEEVGVASHPCFQLPAGDAQFVLGPVRTGRAERVGQHRTEPSPPDLWHPVALHLTVQRVAERH